MTPTRALRVLVSGSYAGCAGHVDRAGAARPDEHTITRLHSHAFRKKVIMVIFAIIVVSILLLWRWSRRERLGLVPHTP